MALTSASTSASTSAVPVPCQCRASALGAGVIRQRRRDTSPPVPCDRVPVPGRLAARPRKVLSSEISAFKLHADSGRVFLRYQEGILARIGSAP